MKIAVSCNGSQIWPHFGHCENFMIYDAEDGKITSEQSVPNPGHRPGFLPNFLADMGVEVMIAGGMGGGAVDIFNERGSCGILQRRYLRRGPFGKSLFGDP